ncbi:MAG: hypothetical protein HQL54_05270 [Magnetococcales bacterium]|nr:hypothetical protein [Magnetococcales bacterium]
MSSQLSSWKPYLGKLEKQVLALKGDYKSYIDAALKCSLDLREGAKRSGNKTVEIESLRLYGHLQVGDLDKVDRILGKIRNAG